MSALASPEQALHYFETAVALDPTSAWPRQLIGHCLATLVIKTKEPKQRQTYFEQALHHFEKSFAYETTGDPDSYRAHLVVGELYTMAGSYDRASEHLLLAAQLGPAEQRQALTVRARRMQLGIETRARTTSSTPENK